MFILSFMVDGKRINHVSTAKAALKPLIDHCVEYKLDWRLWHNGWIDGSNDAWSIFQNIVGETAIILY